MKLVGKNNGFEIYFDCNKQYYSVYRDGRLIIDKKYKYSDVKSYLT